MSATTEPNPASCSASWAVTMMVGCWFSRTCSSGQRLQGVALASLGHRWLRQQDPLAPNDVRLEAAAAKAEAIGIAHVDISDAQGRLAYFGGFLSQEDRSELTLHLGSGYAELD